MNSWSCLLIDLVLKSAIFVSDRLYLLEHKMSAAKRKSDVASEVAKKVKTDDKAKVDSSEVAKKAEDDGEENIEEEEDDLDEEGEEGEEGEDEDDGEDDEVSTEEGIMKI